MPQGRAAQARHQPNRGADAGHRRPAVNHHVHVRRSNTTPGEKAEVRQQIGRVELEGSESGQQCAEQEPGNRGTVKEQDRQARRRVDQRALDLFDIARSSRPISVEVVIESAGFIEKGGVGFMASWEERRPTHGGDVAG